MNQAADRFLIKIFMGTDELARVVFRIGHRAERGRLEYTGSGQPELDAIMATIMRRRLWGWPLLSETLCDELTMATGGRYIPRFHETPIPDGRGGDDSLRKCFRRRASV